MLKCLISLLLLIHGQLLLASSIHDIYSRELPPDDSRELLPDEMWQHVLSMSPHNNLGSMCRRLFILKNDGPFIKLHFPYAVYIYKLDPEGDSHRGTYLERYLYSYNPAAELGPLASIGGDSNSVLKCVSKMLELNGRDYPIPLPVLNYIKIEKIIENISHSLDAFLRSVESPEWTQREWTLHLYGLAFVFWAFWEFVDTVARESAIKVTPYCYGRTDSRAVSQSPLRTVKEIAKSLSDLVAGNDDFRLRRARSKSWEDSRNVESTPIADPISYATRSTRAFVNSGEKSLPDHWAIEGALLYFVNHAPGTIALGYKRAMMELGTLDSSTSLDFFSGWFSVHGIRDRFFAPLLAENAPPVTQNARKFLERWLFHFDRIAKLAHPTQATLPLTH